MAGNEMPLCPLDDIAKRVQGALPSTKVQLVAGEYGDIDLTGVHPRGPIVLAGSHLAGVTALVLECDHIKTEGIDPVYRSRDTICTR